MESRETSRGGFLQIEARTRVNRSMNKSDKTQPDFLKRILIVWVKYFAAYTFIFQTSIFLIFTNTT